MAKKTTDDVVQVENVPEPPKRVPLGTRSLPCRITEEEKREAAMKMALEFRDLDNTVAAKKEAASQFKAQEEGHNASIRRLSTIVTNEFDWRPIDCEKEIDYAAAEAKIFRVDTGEQIDCRALNSDEMQTKLDIQEAEDAAEEEEGK